MLEAVHWHIGIFLKTFYAIKSAGKPFAAFAVRMTQEKHQADIEDRFGRLFTNRESTMGIYATSFFLNLCRQTLPDRVVCIDSRTIGIPFTVFMLNSSETRSYGRAPPNFTKTHGFQPLIPVSGPIRAFNENFAGPSDSSLSPESTMRMIA